MTVFDKIGHLFNFGKKHNMAQNTEFEPTDIIKHRYQDPQVLINYLKTLPGGFTDDKITVKVSSVRSEKPLHTLTYRSELERWSPWPEAATEAPQGRSCTAWSYNLPLTPDQEELEGALNAFVRAERERQGDDED